MMISVPILVWWCYYYIISAAPCMVDLLWCLWLWWWCRAPSRHVSVTLDGDDDQCGGGGANIGVVVPLLSYICSTMHGRPVMVLLVVMTVLRTVPSRECHIRRRWWSVWRRWCQYWCGGAIIILYLQHHGGPVMVLLAVMVVPSTVPSRECHIRRRWWSVWRPRYLHKPLSGFALPD